MGREHRRAAGVVAGLAAGREHAEEAAADRALAEAVGQLPAVAQVELGLHADRVDRHRQAVCRVGRRAVAVLVDHVVDGEARVDEKRGARVDAGDFLDRAAAGCHRHRQVGGGGVLQAFQVQPDVAAVVELLGQRGPELAAVLHRDIGIAVAFADAVEAAELEVQLVAQLAAVGEVNPLLPVVQPGADTERAAADLAGLVAEVDDRAGAVGGQRGRRAAADDVEPVGHEVGAHELVGRGKRHVTDQQHRQAVFLQLHVAAATIGHRQAAHTQVGIAFTAAGFGAQAGHGAQHVHRAGGDDVLQLV